MQHFWESFQMDSHVKGVLVSTQEAAQAWLTRGTGLASGEEGPRQVAQLDRRIRSGAAHLAKLCLLTSSWLWMPESESEEPAREVGCTSECRDPAMPSVKFPRTPLMIGAICSVA